MRCSGKDTFYVDPSVEGCDSLTARARRQGLKTKGFLGEGVTVCVAAAGRARSVEEGGQSRGRRRDRIHRMMTQAQTEPKAEGARQQLRAVSIADRARQLHAVVISGLAFRTWLDGRAACMARGEGAGNKGNAGARPLISLSQRSGTERYKSQEHPRVVIKDLDGLEPDRVQALPPELLRKCNLHEDAPPGICPFTPREQWDREVHKLKKKDAQSGGGKEVAARTPPGPLKPRRGGWCECCEKNYIGTMAEHCGSDQHHASVAEDPKFAVLMRFLSWTARSDGESKSTADTTAADAGIRDIPIAAMQATDLASSRAVVDGARGARTATGNIAAAYKGKACARKGGVCGELAVNGGCGDAARRCAKGGVVDELWTDQRDSVRDVGGNGPPTGEHRVVHGREEKSALGVVGDSTACGPGNSSRTQLTRSGASCKVRVTDAKENIRHTVASLSPSQEMADLSGDPTLCGSLRSHETPGQRTRASHTDGGEQRAVSPHGGFAQLRLPSPIADGLRNVTPVREGVVSSRGAGESCFNREDAVVGSGVPTIKEQEAKGLQGAASVVAFTSPERPGASSAATKPPQVPTATTKTATTKGRTRSSPLQACNASERCGTRRMDGAGSTETHGVVKTSPPSQGSLPGKKQGHAVRMLADSPGFVRALSGNSSASSSSSLSRRDGRHLRSGGGGGRPQGLRGKGGNGAVGTSGSIPPASAMASASSSPASPELLEGVGRTEDTREDEAEPVDDAQPSCNVDDPGYLTNTSGRARNERQQSHGGATAVHGENPRSCSPPNRSQPKSRQQRQLKMLADYSECRLSPACSSRKRRGNGRGVTTRTTDLGGGSSPFVRSSSNGCARRSGDHSTEAGGSGNPERAREFDGRRRSVASPQKRKGSKNRTARSPPLAAATESDEGGGGDRGGGSPSGKREQPPKKKKRRREVEYLLATADSPESERIGRGAAGRSSRRCREGYGNGDKWRAAGDRELSARGGPAQRLGTAASNKPLDISGGKAANRTRRSPGRDQMEHEQPVLVSGIPSIVGENRESYRRPGGVRGRQRTPTPSFGGRMNQENSTEDGSNDHGGSCVRANEETLTVSLSGSFEQVRVSQRFPARSSGPAVNSGDVGIRRDSFRPPQTAAEGSHGERLSPSGCTRARANQESERRPTTLGEITVGSSSPPPSLSRDRRVTDASAENRARSRQGKSGNSGTGASHSVSSTTKHPSSRFRSTTPSPPGRSRVRQSDAVAATGENQRSANRKRGCSGDGKLGLASAETPACNGERVAGGPVRRIRRKTPTDGASTHHEGVGGRVSVPSAPTRAQTMAYESWTRSGVWRRTRKD